MEVSGLEPPTPALRTKSWIRPGRRCSVTWRLLQAALIQLSQLAGLRTGKISPQS